MRALIIGALGQEDLRQAFVHTIGPGVTMQIVRDRRSGERHQRAQGASVEGGSSHPVAWWTP